MTSILPRKIDENMLHSDPVLIILNMEKHEDSMIYCQFRENFTKLLFRIPPICFGKFSTKYGNIN